MVEAGLKCIVGLSSILLKETNVFDQSSIAVIIKLMDVFVNRRSLEPHQGVSQISTEEAVSREDIHVAFVCTENVLHEDNVR